MQYWSREHTKEWIMQLENRIDDIDYFLNRTVEWCEDNYVYDNRLVFMCSFLTCIWVSQVRGEPITFTELMEMLGAEEVESEEEKIYELDEKFIDMEHEELLDLAVKTFREDLED